MEAERPRKGKKRFLKCTSIHSRLRKLFSLLSVFNCVQVWLLRRGWVFKLDVESCLLQKKWDMIICLWEKKVGRIKKYVLVSPLLLGKGGEGKKGEKMAMEWCKKRKSASTQNADTRSMLQRETHNAQSRTHLGKTLPSQDSRHTAAHYDVDIYDAQVRLISRDAEVYTKDARIWARHYQAKIQDMQSCAMMSTCMMLKSGSSAEKPRSANKKGIWMANDSIWEQLSFPFLYLGPDSDGH